VVVVVVVIVVVVAAAKILEKEENASVYRTKLHVLHILVSMTAFIYLP
jgi:hypothetical protein